MRVLTVCALLLAACDPAALPDAGPPGVDSGPPPPPPRVETAIGPVEGNTGPGYREFLGIPYAAPPIGDLRWRPPQRPAPWTEVLVSSRPQRCVQDALGFELSSSEDCLYLNVHTPDPAPVGAPVMVWIHGGAFLFGEGVQTDNGTSGDLLAQQGVVVVSMNYRLGPYGFLAHPALTAEQGGASGNYGLMDQRAALEWVRDNIAAFGGDPDNVTLFGQSAGGLSVCLHVIAPESRGLFHRGITQSGLCDSALEELAVSEMVGLELAASLACEGADALGCLRGKTAEEIEAVDDAGSGIVSELSRERGFWPGLDGAFLTQDFRDALIGGSLAEVPLIVGWTQDEGTVFPVLADTADEPIDEAVYRAVVASIAGRMGATADEVLTAYPLSDYEDPSAAVAAVIGQSTIACPSRRAARLLAEHSSEPLFVYRFDYQDAAFQLPTDRELGAFHASDIQYVFGHPSRIGQREFRGADLTLHENMAAYWARFARGSDPNGDGAAEWPRHDLASGENLVLDLSIGRASGSDEAACALWDAARAR